MFTGIIEETGKVLSVKRNAKSLFISIEGNIIFGDIKIGDSISVNGVCLTVSSFSSKIFNSDVMNETIERTSLKTLKEGSKVNLERAMICNGRFGGHIVLGHVDGTGVISGIKNVENSILITIETSKDIIKYIVEKGSIAIDGISLTVVKVFDNSFQVSIIPHTFKNTILNDIELGKIVNLENDIIGKYIEKFVKTDCKENTLTKDLLMKSGFL